jgi:AhpC/TSA family
MSTMTPLIPRLPVPDLAVSLVGGGRWRLSEQRPKSFTMVVVYRGLHCPICKGYLSDLNAKLGQFEGHGVGVIAISSDTAERAQRAKSDWRLDRLLLGYGLTLQQGRSWGLYVSSGRGVTSSGVEVVRGAGVIPDPPRSDALLCLGADHAVRAARLRRHSEGGRVHSCQQLPGARRGRRAAGRGRVIPPASRSSPPRALAGSSEGGWLLGMAPPPPFRFCRT